MIFSSCKKKEDETAEPAPVTNTFAVDTLPPVIHLNGSDTLIISLNTLTADPFGTAVDAHDGSVILTSNWSASNPDINLKGSYDITYTAQDTSGNIATQTRKVNVVNDADFMAGTYLNAKDSCATIPVSFFTALVTTSSTVNGKFIVSNFGAFGTSVVIDCMLDTNNHISAPGNQSLGGAAILQSVFFSGSLVVSLNSPVIFTIKYQWTDGTINDICISTYTK